jgi:hypothetical protein
MPRIIILLSLCALFNDAATTPQSEGIEGLANPGNMARFASIGEVASQFYHSRFNVFDIDLPANIDYPAPLIWGTKISWGEGL